MASSNSANPCPSGTPRRRLCVLQMHHTDAEPKLLEKSAVPHLMQSGLFDEVVLCVADIPENDRLEEYARAWGIDLIRGAERDVARRIADVARATDCTSIARALVWWFFIDLGLVQRQLEMLEETDADWIDLPRDFDQRFGVDAFGTSFLEKVERAFVGDPALRERYGLNPWSFVESNPAGFDVQTCHEVPELDEVKFNEVRRDMASLWPERWDGAGTPLFPYRLAHEILKSKGSGLRALDVASGLGAGTALLGEVAQATGVDLDGESIARCMQRYGEQAEFIAGDAMQLDLPKGSFDMVTSVHTMEHVQDDRAFLEGIHSWLRPGGVLVLEVPFLARGPFNDVTQPLSPDHVREYDAPTLLALVEERFEIQKTYGVARGAYVELDRARSAGLIVARKAA
ncbi:MAG: SAM-dependent methyltransferase [Planctomycetota bacterium]|jgi:SAM-dependent methyltransferase